MPTLPERLKLLRGKSQETQAQIASLLGVTERHYRLYEAGKVDPPTSKAVCLADHFDVSLDFLIGRTNRSMAEQLAHDMTMAQVTKNTAGASIGEVYRRYNVMYPGFKKMIEDDMANAPPEDDASK